MVKKNHEVASKINYKLAAAMLGEREAENIVSLISEDVYNVSKSN